MASKAAIIWAEEICKKYHVLYDWNTEGVNYAYSFIGCINVDTTQPNRDFISTVFHEIQHCLNFRNKKYMKYHKHKVLHSGNRKRIQRLLNRWMIPAELYTDKMAEKLAAKHGFYKYKGFYTEEWKKDKQVLKNGVKEWIRSL